MTATEYKNRKTSGKDEWSNISIQNHTSARCVSAKKHPLCPRHTPSFPIVEGEKNSSRSNISYFTHNMR